MNNIDFNSSEYKRSRVAYMVQCTIEYMISLLVTDVFIAKLLTSIGISDAVSGIISSFISLAFVIQLFSIVLMKTKCSVKKIIGFDALSIFRHVIDVALNAPFIYSKAVIP